MERVKAIQRNATAAADSDNFRPELVEDEPRYLRRQKPVEIRRKKFGAKNWSQFRRISLWGAIAIAAGVAGYFAVDFARHSPRLLLAKPEQIDLAGNHVVARDSIVGIFRHDAGKSVLTIPLDERRSEIEQIGWVESATVQRILPNRLRVEVTERTPVAFARNGNEIVLIDAHGVLLDRPADVDMRFPIVSGVSDSLAREERERRMQIYEDLVRSLNIVNADSSAQLSEVDLSNPKNVRIVMAGIPGVNAAQAVTIKFGSGDFTPKYRMLVENFAQWQANAGCVHSVDLQFTRQIVLNPDNSGCGERGETKKSK
ncbi:MAG: FtsQ-type POTRA domain-containing protein [Acidobacteria bacterium]|nr:FtsQ-type POTRA domain-containing protein [Acidobacteriota bacterium]MBS1865707.1 FtsQ-type POTRA domain-containing protein [Acidobacteriota bacterium]